MNQVDNEPVPGPKIREETFRKKTDLDIFVEEVINKLKADKILKTSQVVPDSKRGITLLNLLRIKWLASDSIDLRRKYRGK